MIRQCASNSTRITALKWAVLSHESIFEHVKIAKGDLLGLNDCPNTRICDVSQIDFAHRCPIVDFKKRVVGVTRMTAQLDNFALRKRPKKIEKLVNRLIMIEFVEGCGMRDAFYDRRANPSIMT